MSEPPELWTFVFANLFVFGFGATLTTLSYYAYRQNNRSTSFRLSTIGFGILTIGGVVEPIYQLGIRGDYMISGRELLALQSMENMFFAVGLGFLFYSIYVHRNHQQIRHFEQVDSSSETQ